MAIYHLSVKAISRSGGRSAVASVAYRAGERLTNERDGLTHDYSRRKGVAHTEILAPDNAPDWVHDRGRLWNGVEAIEKRKDARLAREVEVSLPRELTRAQQIDTLCSFVREEFVSRGMVADIALHAPIASDGLEQPHAHILLTTRELGREGFGKKVREWDRTEALEEWRVAWAKHANRALEGAGQGARIDHRSLATQRVEALEIANDTARPEPERRLAEVRAIELDREPQPKLGPAAAALERRGTLSLRGDMVRTVTERNSLRRQIADIGQKVADLGRATVEKAQDLFEGLDLSAARAVVNRAVSAGLRLRDGKAFGPATPAARCQRSFGRFAASAQEIEAFQADGLVIPPSMAEAHRTIQEQMRRDLHAWSKTEPDRAWEAVKQFGQRRPQEGRELQIELGKELKRDPALTIQAPAVGEEIARTLQPVRGRGWSR